MFIFFFLDLPATNDDAESDFGEDEFLPRNTSLALDEHYWNTELTEKLIKVKFNVHIKIVLPTLIKNSLHDCSKRVWIS